MALDGGMDWKDGPTIPVAKGGNGTRAMPRDAGYEKLVEAGTKSTLS
ncbi:MAG: hypothetical protein Kow0063_07620 [Anaerolineae bacterium]